MPLLEMRGIEKSFPGVRALCGIDLTLRRGELLALLGENGAGKSTLIKTLGGVHRPDAGKIRIDGVDVDIASPAEAIAAGIGVIHQDFNLVPALSAWENIFLGREDARAGFVRRSDERSKARELFERIGVPVNVDTPCGRLPVAHQQVVEIAKALSQQVRILVMDEPSATLTLTEVDRLYAVIRDLKQQGIGIIYISHRLDEVFEIADRVSVLRDGRHVGDCLTTDVDRPQLIEMMVGRTLENEFPQRNVEVGPPRLVVRDLKRSPAVQGVSLKVHRGEVLALTGLVGAGRTETVRLIFGADRRDSGEIELDGRTLRINNPRDAIRAGICLLTEDRKAQGLVLGQSVLENFGLSNLSQLSTAGFINAHEERNAFAGYVQQLQIKIPNDRQTAGNLSGGNQQKIVLAKWLEKRSEVIIFDEPTRGIDVGAKFEIYLLINRLAAAGKAVVMISSELPEVLGMADRILVMHEGRITGEITDARNATQVQIMELAVR